MKKKIRVEEVKSKTGERWMKLAENPPMWVQQLVVGKITGNALSGTENKEAEGEVTFKKKSSESSLSESQMRHMKVVQAMEQELDEEQLEKVLHSLRANLALSAGYESTIECNPENITAKKPKMYHECG